MGIIAKSIKTFETWKKWRCRVIYTLSASIWAQDHEDWSRQSRDMPGERIWHGRTESAMTKLSLSRHQLPSHHCFFFFRRQNFFGAGKTFFQEFCPRAKENLGKIIKQRFKISCVFLNCSKFFMTPGPWLLASLRSASWNVNTGPGNRNPAPGNRKNRIPPAPKNWRAKKFCGGQNFLGRVLPAGKARRAKKKNQWEGLQFLVTKKLTG